MIRSRFTAMIRNRDGPAVSPALTMMNAQNGWLPKRHNLQWCGLLGHNLPWIIYCTNLGRMVQYFNLSTVANQQPAVPSFNQGISELNSFITYKYSQFSTYLPPSSPNLLFTCCICATAGAPWPAKRWTTSLVVDRGSRFWLPGRVDHHSWTTVDPLSWWIPSNSRGVRWSPTTHWSSSHHCEVLSMKRHGCLILQRQALLDDGFLGSWFSAALPAEWFLRSAFSWLVVIRR